MSDVRPTTDQVRDAYARARQVFGDPERTYDDMADEFDRWFSQAVPGSLAAHQQISEAEDRIGESLGDESPLLRNCGIGETHESHTYLHLWHGCPERVTECLCDGGA